MMRILETLLPVFFLIGLAYVLGRRGWLSREFFHQLNWVIYWISLPALIVSSLIGATQIPPDTLPLIGIFTAATLTVVVLGIGVARLLGLPREHLGTFLQSVFRGNLAYTGLPILLFAVRNQSPAQVDAVVAQAVFLFAPTMVLYNTLAVLLLLGYRRGFSGGEWKRIILEILRNPLILASALGALLFVLAVPLPAILTNTLSLAGQMASPAALLCVGGAMAFVSLQGRHCSSLTAALLKCAALPAITLAFANYFALTPTALLVVLIFSACPTAVASYMMAKQLHGDEALAAGSIVLSTLLCIPILGWIVANY